MMLLMAAPAVLAGKGAAVRRSVPITMWRQHNNIRALNLYYGNGGRENLPQPPFRFVRRSEGGSAVKFEIKDGRGVRWMVKLGSEAQAETVATRLLWAAGYHADVTYYYPVLKVSGLEGLEEGPMPSGELVSDKVQGARLERIEPNQQHINWDWRDNPFHNRRELNGLKVMMALINNWDLKKSNNGVYLDSRSGLRRYYVHDLGASFGRTGNEFKRSKNDLEDYAESRIIKDVSSKQVDLVMDTRPYWLFAVYPPQWRERTRIAKLMKDIPRADARWMGQVLSQLSPEQLRDAFRAAHYQPEEVRMYADVLRVRINQLARL